MSAPAKCPGCGAKLPPEAEHCPECPMSFTAPPEGRDNPLRGDLFRHVILPLLFLAAVGWGLWTLAQAFMRLGSAQLKDAAPAAAAKAPVQDAAQDEGVVEITVEPAAPRRKARR